MYDKYHFESQSIRWSVVVLCVSLLLVYIVLYYAKWDLWKTDIVTNQNSTWDIKISEINYWMNSENVTWLVDNTWLYLNNTWYDIYDEGYVLKDNLTQTWSKNKLDTDAKMLILSWTNSYYGELDFVEKLWISYQYALKDSKDIYYINMWDYKYDFSDIARKLKWSLYIINTDQELISNGLFWDKVTFINVPEYKNKKVLLLLDVNNQSWLLAIDYSIYHQVKTYLKSLFIY